MADGTDWQCPLCLNHFRGVAKSRHQRNLYLTDENPHRCDKKKITVDNVTETASRCKNSDVDAELENDKEDFAAPVIRRPLASLHELARRPPVNTEAQRRLRMSKYILGDSVVPHGMMPRNMVTLMEQWRDFGTMVAGTASPSFWKLFLRLHTQPGVAIDAALSSVRTLFVPTSQQKLFPGSRRTLLQRISQFERKFWPHVLHTVRIDLSSFNLPQGISHLHFKFVDPIFGWCVAAKRQRMDDMHFVPLPETNQHGERTYGGGIHQGKRFEEAYRTCPEGAYPMGFRLHWDGTGAKGVEAAPICVGVSNINSSHPSTEFCLGYMPTLPRRMGKTFKESDLATTVKFHIRQQAVAAIMRVLEAGARSGVLCPLVNCHGRKVNVLLMPRMLSIPIDQPEAQLFYGMKNRWSCSHCHRREGYSAFRRRAPLDGHVIQVLYRFASDEGSAWCDAAKRRLSKYGFNPSRRCVLLTLCCDALLVRVPNSVEAFPCGDVRDKMHGIFIFLHRMLTETLSMVSWKSKKGLRIKEILDQRLALLCERRNFRFLDDDRSFRLQRSIFSDVNMSATDRVCVMTLLPHVFGHQGLIIPADVRRSLLTAISVAQLVLIACRQRREYTASELHLIFDQGYVDLFRSLEHIHMIHKQAQYDRAAKKYSNNPDINPPAKRFKSRRYELTDRIHTHTHTLPPSHSLSPRGRAHGPNSDFRRTICGQHTDLYRHRHLSYF